MALLLQVVRQHGVLSSRGDGVFKVTAVVPPRHQQILLVLPLIGPRVGCRYGTSYSYAFRPGPARNTPRLKNQPGLEFHAPVHLGSSP